MNTPLDRTSLSMLGHYAGFVTRLMAFIVDVVLVSAVIVFVSWFTNATVDMLQGQMILRSLMRAAPALAGLTEFAASPVTHSVVSVLFIIGYYLFFWTVAGQTPGKYLLGIRILARSGSRLRLRHAIVRYIGYYLSGLCFGLGFLWILFDDERRGWHDRLAGTCVLYVWDARPDERFLKRITTELLERRLSLRRRFGRGRSRSNIKNE